MEGKEGTRRGKKSVMVRSVTQKDSYGGGRERDITWSVKDIGGGILKKEDLSSIEGFSSTSFSTF